MVTLLEKSLWIRSALALMTLVLISLSLNWCFSQVTETVQGLLATEPTVSHHVHKNHPSSEVLALLAEANHPKGRRTVPNRSVPSVPGRLDPFSPLVEDPDAPGADKLLLQKPFDPFSNLEYTGLIHGRRHNDSLAMLRINDTVLGETTVIRKAGQTVPVKGSNVRLLSVNEQAITVELNGKRCIKTLRPIVDLPDDSSHSSTSVPTTLPTDNQTTADSVSETTASKP